MGGYKVLNGVPLFWFKVTGKAHPCGTLLLQAPALINCMNCLEGLSTAVLLDKVMSGVNP
jgi:hypothetical protein